MQLLYDLYMQPSHQPADIPKIHEIICNAMKDSGYKIKVDDKNNMFLYHPDSKCKNLLCAHMDMVKTGNPIANVIHHNGLLFGVDKDFHQTSCGADDKNGVWLCIKAALESGQRPAILFVAHEEGSPHTVDDWLENEENQVILSYYDNCLVLDRANDKEIIYAGSYKSYSHALACQWKAVNEDWTFVRGVMCDADRLIDYIPSINLSIGYYNGHCPSEFTMLDELLTTKDALFKFLNSKKKNRVDWNVIKEFNKTLKDDTKWKY